MTLAYEPQPRDRLYYDQYRYCLTFQLKHSSRSRSLDPDKIRANIQFANLLVWAQNKVTFEEEQNLLECARVFRESTESHKRIVYSNWQYVYSNHQGLLAQLHSLDFVKHVRLTEATVTLPRDVILLKNSQYRFRSYFSNRWFNREEVSVIRNFLVSRGQQFRTTPGVRSRLSGEFFYPNNWMFVDHNNEQDAFLLNLVVSQCIRKTLPIQIAK